MEAQRHWAVFYMPWPEIALSQGEKKQRRIKESGDEAILTAGNCLICHVALSVGNKKKKSGRHSSAPAGSGPVIYKYI